MSNKARGIFSFPEKDRLFERYSITNTTYLKIVRDYLQDSLLLSSPKIIQEGPFLDQNQGELRFEFDREELESYLEDFLTEEELRFYLSRRYGREELEDKSIGEMKGYYLKSRLFDFMDEVNADKLFDVELEENEENYILYMRSTEFATFDCGVYAPHVKSKFPW
mgnify:CR=1 FL=1